MVYIEKFKKILIMVCVSALLVGCFSVTALAAEPIEPQSPAVLVTELTSDTVLLSKEPGMSINPGSIVKITALYVAASACFEGRVSLSDTITITRDVMGKDSGQIPLKEEETFTLEQLLYLMYMDYSETAAVAAAAHIAGSVDGFVDKMNSAASEAGCRETHFVNMTGAYSEGQKTTPEDLLLILKSAMQNTVFMDIFTATSYTVKDTNKSISRSIGTPDLLQRPNSEFYVRNCKGGRIGGFSDSGYTTISLSEASDSGMKLIVITAGNMSYNGCYEDTKNIIQWTLDNFSWQTIIKVGEALTKIPVTMGSGTDYVVAGADKNINVLIDNDISALDFKQDITIYSERKGETLMAPIKRGDVLGELTLSYDGKEYGTVTLVANKDVELRRWEYFKSEVRETLHSSGIIWCIVIVCIMLVCYIVYSALFWLRQMRKKRELADARIGIINAKRKGTPLENVEAILHRDNGNGAERDTSADEDTAENTAGYLNEYPVDAAYELIDESEAVLDAEYSESADNAELAEQAEQAESPFDAVAGSAESMEHKEN